jgi:hypothetical protein
MFNGRRQPSCDGTSRISREAYVRFCERLGVKFPGPTRPARLCADVRDHGESWSVSGPSDIESALSPAERHLITNRAIKA